MARIKHIALSTDDPAKTAEFYKKVFGLEELHRRPKDTGADGVWLSDGYIWGMIRNGRGLMPSYNRIEELERWDVVNYLRGLQGRYPVDTSMALPGVTGGALPRASVAAPTRPAPFFNPVRARSGGQLPTGAARGPAADSVLARDITSAGGGRRP
jgi:catechol 2,3-dioxygenase-like lactoylglutathione lyase family enzyme